MISSYLHFLTQSFNKANDLLKGCDSFLINSVEKLILEYEALLDLEQETNQELTLERAQLETCAKQLTLTLLFENPVNNSSHKHYSFGAIINITPGSGGQDAQDWSEMLLSMYVSFCNTQGWCYKETDKVTDSVGLRSVTLEIDVPYAYGWLISEHGVHRLIRRSPFDANNKRHTSFANVEISPLFTEHQAPIVIPRTDLRVDTYRSSGAGGQHVNKTDSAVRITHLPTGIVVQCQSDRSQHRNFISAQRQLLSKLVQLESQNAKLQKQELVGQKALISWGQQIRSYNLDKSIIKDHRTNFSVTHITSILEGGKLESFVLAFLIHIKQQQ